MHLSKYDPESDEWRQTGMNYPMVTESGRIETIEDFGMEAGVTYKLEIYKDGVTTEHDMLENVEMGERYGIEFSLKLDFSEFDDQKLAENL